MQNSSPLRALFDLIRFNRDCLQWNWSSLGSRFGSLRKPPMCFWLRASMCWLMVKITTSPCCCTSRRPLSSWNSWLLTPSSVSLIRSPSRESQRSQTPCKLPRGSVSLWACSCEWESPLIWARLNPDLLPRDFRMSWLVSLVLFKEFLALNFQICFLLHFLLTEALRLMQRVSSSGHFSGFPKRKTCWRCMKASCGFPLAILTHLERSACLRTTCASPVRMEATVTSSFQCERWGGPAGARGCH